MQNKQRFVADQRWDLPEFDLMLSYIDTELQNLNKSFFSGTSRVIQGWAVEDAGGLNIHINNSIASVLMNSTRVGFENLHYRAAGATYLTLALANNATNYVEVQLTTSTGVNKTVAIWDPTANSGAGGEFTQGVDTATVETPVLVSNTVSFTGNADRLPLATVTTTGGTISGISDARKMFFHVDSDFSFGSGDVAILTLKNAYDALATSVKSMKGSTNWWGTPAYSFDTRGASGDQLVTRVGLLTDCVTDEQEDRSAQLYSTTAVSWNGTQLSFANDITLFVTNNKSGGVGYSETVLAASSPIAINDGEVIYIYVNRTTNTNTTPIRNSVTPLPAHAQATKDLFVLFKRIGSDLLVPLHKQLITTGTTVKLGTAPGPLVSKNYPTVFLSPAGNGDVTTFAAALAALPSAGGVILLMDNITVSVGVSLPHNVKLLGRAQNAIVTLTGSGSISIVGDHVTIQDVSFVDTVGAYVILSRGGSYLNVEGCTIAMSPLNAGYGVTFANDGNGNFAHGGTVSKCLFTGVLAPSLGNAIRFTLGSSDNTESDNTFSI